MACLLGSPPITHSMKLLHVQCCTSLGAHWEHTSPTALCSHVAYLLAACRYLWSSGTLCVLAAALIFSVSALLVKLTGNRIPVLQITLVRSSVSWLVGITLCWQQRISPMFGHRKRLGWLVMRGLSGECDSSHLVEHPWGWTVRGLMPSRSAWAGLGWAGLGFSLEAHPCREAMCRTVLCVTWPTACFHLHILSHGYCLLPACCCCWPAAAGASAMTTYYVSLLLLPMADAVTLFFLNPTLTAILVWLVRGEHLGWLGAAGCLSSFSGLLLLVHPPFLFGGHQDWGYARSMGVVAGLVSSCLCAAAFLCIRMIGKEEPALVVALWFHTATLVVSSLPLAVGWPQPAVAMSGAEWGLLLSVAGTSFMGQLLMTRGFQLMPASRASSINMTQVRRAHGGGGCCGGWGWWQCSCCALQAGDVCKQAVLSNPHCRRRYCMAQLPQGVQSGSELDTHQ